MLGAPPRNPKDSRGPTGPVGPSLGAPPAVARAPEESPFRISRFFRLGDRIAVPKVALGIGGGVLLLVVVLGLAFGPIVRSKVTKEATKRHLLVEVGGVRPGFFAATLKDVKVKLEGVDGVSVRIDEVHVDLTAGLSLREVAARGGAIELEGEPEDLVSRLKAFQNAHPGAHAAEKTGPRTPMSAEGLALSWKMPSEGEIVGSSLKLARDTETTKIGFGKLTAKHRALALDVIGGEVELGPDNVARRIAATSVAISHEGPKAAPPTPKAAPPPEVPPPLPAALPSTKGRAAKAVKAAAVVEPVNDEPVLPLPDLHALRARIGALATSFASRIPDGTKVDFGGLAVKVDIGGDPFAFGPGPFVLERHGDRVRLAFTSDDGKSPASAAAQKSTPLSIEAELPLHEGDVTARLSGGPVSLAMLGVKEGTKGLFDVAKGTVSGKGQLVLSAAGDALTFDGQVALRSISIKQPRLSHEALRGIDLAVAARGVLDDAGRLRIDDAQVDMGALHLRTHGTVEETRDHFGVSLATDIAPASCQALLESTPEGLLPTVRAARMSGTFGAKANVVFDTRSIDKLTLEYQVDDQCRLYEVPRDLSRDRFSGSFTYRTYHPDGTASDTTTGPGTSAWTDLDAISPFMMAAVLTTEDGAFYKHKGFNHHAIKNSVAANLKAKRFVRGASTITMQLAKNLFLSREKTLSRKIEEVILTDYLEQAFRKDDMMELYLNIVEFGPDIYGVTRAADYYFGRKPEELSLPESFFLASLMPSPIRYGKQRDKGQVSEGWMRHLQALMEIAAKNNKVTRAELADGLAQPVVFHKPGDPRPEPRKPAGASRRDPYGDDSGWQPLD